MDDMSLPDKINALLGDLSLKDVPPEMVQFSEDAEHYYIDIGRNFEIDKLWKESFDRIKELENKFDRAMLDILHDLQAQEM